MTTLHDRHEVTIGMQWTRTAWLWFVYVSEDEILDEGRSWDFAEAADQARLAFEEHTNAKGGAQ